MYVDVYYIIVFFKNKFPLGNGIWTKSIFDWEMENVNAND